MTRWLWFKAMYSQLDRRYWTRLESWMNLSQSNLRGEDCGFGVYLNPGLRWRASVTLDYGLWLREAT